MVNCDFVVTEPQKLIRPVSSAMVGGLDQALEIEGTRRSRVLAGCELVPAYVVGGSTAGATYRVRPGVVLFPNGLVGYQSALSSGFGYWDMDLDTQIETIGGSTIWTAADGNAPNINFFYHFMRMKAGDSGPTRHMDVNPPDAYGHPQSVGGTHSAGGYTVNDYAFIGTLTVFDVKAGSVGACFKSGALVEDLGGGLRKFGIANVHKGKANSDFVNSATIAATAAGGTNTQIVFDDSALQEVVHAKECQMSITGTITETGVSGGGSAHIRCPGMHLLFESIAISSSTEFSAVVNVPLQDGSDIDAALDSVSLGTYSAALKIGMAMFVEDVNNLRRRGPAVAAF